MEFEAPALTPDRADVAPRFDSSRALRLLKELGTNITEDLVVLMPNLLSFLKHDDPAVVRQSISSGTNLFAAVLEEMALQLNKSGKVDGWLKEMWSWMVQFKDAVRGMVCEPGPVAMKLLFVKFLETCVLCFTPQPNNGQVPVIEGKNWSIDTSRLAQVHPSLDPAVLKADARETLSLLLNILQSAYVPRGSFVVAIINCLTAIAKNRPLYYNDILPALLGFDLESVKGAHSASIRYSLRTAFLGFLRCPYQAMIESKDILVRAVRTLSPGEATEQIIRQVEKMSRNIERVSRDTWVSKDDPPPVEIPYEDLNRKRPATGSSDIPAISDDLTKRTCFDVAVGSNPPVQITSDMQVDDDTITDSSSNAALMNSHLSPAEKMVGVIGALLAEGKRGAESLEIVISTAPADLMADIVIETMKHLPETSFPLSTRNGALPTSFQASSCFSSEVASTISHSAPFSSQFAPAAANNGGVSMPASDAPVIPSVHADAKRDPRRDPRRLDPRRMVAPAATNSGQLNIENTMNVHQRSDHLSNKPSFLAEVKAEKDPGDLHKSDSEQFKISTPAQLAGKEDPDILNDARQPEPAFDVHTSPDTGFSPPSHVDQELANPSSSETTTDDGLDSSNLEFDLFSSPITETSFLEDTNHDVSMLPSHMELSGEEKLLLHNLAVGRVIDDYKSNSVNARFPLLSRLLAQNAVDDRILELLQKHIIFDYHRHKGHELAMHVLYQLQTVIIADSQENSTSIATRYEKFFVSLMRSLIDALPASDKSLGKLLGEAPFLPDSVFRLLEDLCQSHSSHHHIKDNDADRVTQGLGTVWSLILGRPPIRQACLNIALKCAVHPQDEVRAKAVRLVANKLYPLTYASEKIEQFATDMLLAVVDQPCVEAEVNWASSKESKEEFQIGGQETSISGSQNSDPVTSESESLKSSLVSPKQSAVSPSQAQCHTSLFFSLCTKKPSLLRHVFDVYGRAPKAVKHSINWHIPIILRNLGSSYSELLDIIHNLPDGSESLVALILQKLSEESNPSADLIAAVKHLYETKLKDVAILIPLLSSLPKEEVLPIFPRFVDLPLDKFQAALARILQGSAHTGPALSPAEVLIAIHDINPEKDRVALKKIFEACTACFEQRTVFTQQVLEKSLNQLVDKIPIPLLFMRTVIQAVDAFPALVDFVMGILSRLVSKQIWRMQKLWVGFLKCAYQTQPHSFHVLLQLPPQQLETALIKYPNLRAPLAAYVNQQNMHKMLPRQTLVVLGLVNEPQQVPRSSVPATLQASPSS